MQETAQITTALKYLPWGKHVALLTDGRFSGISTGACIGHIGPEALQGGPIGRVRDGDVIEIVIDRRTSDRLDQSGRRAGERCAGRAACAAARRGRTHPALRTARGACPTTRGCGRRCSARAAARGAAASTTSTGSSRCSTPAEYLGRAGRSERGDSRVKLYRTHERASCSSATARFIRSHDDWDSPCQPSRTRSSHLRAAAAYGRGEPTIGGDVLAAGAQSGSVGGGRHVSTQPHRADGGVEESPAAAASTTACTRPSVRSCFSRRRRGAFAGRRDDSRAARREVERARARARAMRQLRGRDRRLHDRQRHELARHRRRESALPAAGEDVRRLVCAWARRCS